MEKQLATVTLDVRADVADVVRRAECRLDPVEMGQRPAAARDPGSRGLVHPRVIEPFRDRIGPALDGRRDHGQGARQRGLAGRAV